MNYFFIHRYRLSEGPDTTPSSDDESLPQVYQQVVTASGEIKHIPVQLSEAQMQAIRLQMQQVIFSQSVIFFLLLVYFFR